MFYRRKELGSLQLFGLSKKQITRYLIFERLLNCVCAVLKSSAIFFAAAVLLKLVFDISIFVPLWKIGTVIALIIFYNSSLTFFSARSVLKKDIRTLIY